MALTEEKKITNDHVAAKAKVKTISFESENATSGIVLGETSVRIVANEDTGIQITEKGITITGPVSFVAGASQIRTGGLWTFQSEIQGSLPSTMATPTPQYIISPPVKQINMLMEHCLLMMSMM